MTKIFRDYVESPPSGLNEEESRNWFREKAADVQRLYAANVLRKKAVVNTPIMISGRCYFFRYDAKTKDVLPYYDMYPVIFPIKVTKTHFLGLNLHYLPITFRAALMDNLYPYVTGEEAMSKVKMSYNILLNSSKLRFYKPCLKQYLNNHIRSKLVEVSVEEWELALFLPLQRFVGSTLSNVHRDSVRTIRSSQTR